MSTRAYWVLVVAVAALALLFELAIWMELIVATAVLAVVPWYFGTRDRGAKPSNLERRLAAAWRWTRRLLCFAAGALCLWGAFERLFFGGDFWQNPFRLFAVALMLFLGIVLIVYGVLGGGGDRRR